MAKVPFHRQVGRLCAVVLGFHAFMTSSLALYSRCCTDHFFTQHWDYSTSVLLRRTNFFCFWEPSFYLPALSGDERACLEAWLRVLTLEVPSLTSRFCSPHIVVQDSLAVLDGMGEMRDSVYALWRCLHKVTPEILEIRRERQGDVTFLHCRMVLEVEMRVPLTSFSFSVFRIPTTTTLELQKPRYRPNRFHISAAEHRWWGGPIWSAQTGSVRSPWGDIGDLLRRYNGFMMSAMITKQSSLLERVDSVRVIAHKIDSRVRVQQERQLAEVQEDHKLSEGA